MVLPPALLIPALLLLLLLLPATAMTTSSHARFASERTQQEAKVKGLVASLAKAGCRCGVFDAGAWRACSQTTVPKSQGCDCSEAAEAACKDQGWAAWLKGQECAKLVGIRYGEKMLRQAARDLVRLNRLAECGHADTSEAAAALPMTADQIIKAKGNWAKLQKSVAKSQTWALYDPRRARPALEKNRAMRDVQKLGDMASCLGVDKTEFIRRHQLKSYSPAVPRTFGQAAENATKRAYMDSSGGKNGVKSPEAATRATASTAGSGGP